MQVLLQEMTQLTHKQNHSWKHHESAKDDPASHQAMILQAEHERRANVAHFLVEESADTVRMNELDESTGASNLTIIPSTTIHSTPAEAEESPPATSASATKREAAFGPGWVERLPHYSLLDVRKIRDFSSIVFLDCRSSSVARSDAIIPGFMSLQDFLRQRFQVTGCLD